MESLGRERYKCFKHVKALYDHRSKAAHGDNVKGPEPYEDTYTVARRVLLKMIETRHVPKRNELEATLFGDDIGITGGTSTAQ